MNRRRDKRVVVIEGYRPQWKPYKPADEAMQSAGDEPERPALRWQDLKLPHGGSAIEPPRGQKRPND